MKSITITIPIPAKELSPNWRGHWATKARRKAESREAASWRSKTFLAVNAERQPRWERASARVTFHWPDKRRRDPDNAMASLKATWDGIADAGIVANDSGIWPERPVFAVDRANPRVEIIITKENVQVEARRE